MRCIYVWYGTGRVFNGMERKKSQKGCVFRPDDGGSGG